MQPTIIVEVEIAADPTPRLFRIGVVMEINFFVLERPPETFGQNVIQRPPFAVHADPHSDLLQSLGVERRSEVRALIAVPDPTPSNTQAALDALHDEGHLQRLV